MFTGLIETIGEIAARSPEGGRTRLRVACAQLAGAGLSFGESIAVDGCCLTVVAFDREGFSVEVSPESLARTTLVEARAGTKVNLERALALGGRLGGHLVLGHVDGVGTIVKREDTGAFLTLDVEVPAQLEPWLLPKGSVTVDGVSLTVNEVHGARFSVMLIPETQARTTLGRKPFGAKVNLEGDIIGKYVAHLVARTGAAPRLDERFLKEHGFA